MGISIEIKGLKEVMDISNKYPSISNKYVGQAIAKSLIYVEGRANTNAPRGATGNLRKNWKIKTKPFEGSLRSDANEGGFYYGVAVEYGTRPHYPPVKSLERWANSKGISPYAVARSIAKKGTKANPFFQKSANESENTINQLFDKALEDIINNI